jgi:hypothetical protein
VSREYQLWADGQQIPYDRAACGFCLSQHESNLCCVLASHAPLRKAAREAHLVKLVNRLRTGIERDKQEIRKTFLKLRKKYKRFWKK